MTRERHFPATLALIGALLVVDSFVPAGLGLMGSPALAIVGRPMTPVSVAGVARRTTRRSVAYGAAAAPTVVYAAPAPAPTTCYEKYDAYGRKVTTCY